MRASFPSVSLAAAFSALFSALLLVTAVAPAAAQGAKMDETNNPADAAYISAMHDLMVGMHRAMPTGDTDRDFVRMMLPHDQSALDMAKAEVKYGRDPDVKAMAQRLIDEQDRQIAALKAWQEKHPQ